MSTTITAEPQSTRSINVVQAFRPAAMLANDLGTSSGPNGHSLAQSEVLVPNLFAEINRCVVDSFPHVEPRQSEMGTLRVSTK